MSPGNDKDKSRGSMLFVGGLIMLLFLDNDAALDHHVESGEESYVVHALYAMFDQLGKSATHSYTFLHISNFMPAKILLFHPTATCRTCRNCCKLR